MIIIKNREQIEGIKKSCRLARQTLDYTAGFIKPGISTEDLNRLAHDYIVSHQAIPAPLNYEGFPKSTCISINNIVCHGIPSKKVTLKEGDIVNIDITTILNGYYGDVSETYPVGRVSKDASLLLERTKKSLNLAIDKLKPGRSLNDCVGKVIEPYIQQFGYSIVRELGGHGVGVKFHEDPFVFHFDSGGIHDTLLRPGMVFTIEPMVNNSEEWRIKLDRSDGWTIRTLDGSLSAQFEHTLLITDSGHEILTK